jgi:serine/threonine protein phosphatase 1
MYKEILKINQRKEFSFYQIEKNAIGRNFVIADIHGCSKTFKKLLEQINLQKSDYLFLLGDYIDKGIDSVGVLNIILELIDNDFQIFPLRGNHEEMIIEKHLKEYSDEELQLPNQFRVKGILDFQRNIEKKYESFFLNLPYYYELSDTILVHAGLNLNEKEPLKDYESMLWIRDFGGAEKYKKRIIHGHTTILYQIIEAMIKSDEMIINLDNGCVYKHKWYMGNLVCLELNEMILYKEKNID